MNEIEDQQPSTSNTRKKEWSIVRSPSIFSETASVSRKPVPPVPKKPMAFSNTDSQPDLPGSLAPSTVDDKPPTPPLRIRRHILDSRLELPIRPNQIGAYSRNNELQASNLGSDTLMDEDNKEAGSFPVLRPLKPGG